MTLKYFKTVVGLLNKKGALDPQWCKSICVFSRHFIEKVEKNAYDYQPPCNQCRLKSTPTRLTHFHSISTAAVSMLIKTIKRCTFHGNHIPTPLLCTTID